MTKTFTYFQHSGIMLDDHGEQVAIGWSGNGGGGQNCSGTIDTTVAQAFDITVTWGTASTSNAITSNTFVLANND